MSIKRTAAEILNKGKTIPHSQKNINKKASIFGTVNKKETSLNKDDSRISNVSGRLSTKEKIVKPKSIGSQKSIGSIHISHDSRTSNTLRKQGSSESKGKKRTDSYNLDYKNRYKKSTEVVKRNSYSDISKQKEIYNVNRSASRDGSEDVFN